MNRKKQAETSDTAAEYSVAVSLVILFAEHNVAFLTYLKEGKIACPRV